MESPRWEHGFRVHGYWTGIVQWGRVGIGHGRVPKNNGYSWMFTPPDGQLVEGYADTLRQAKRTVEKMFAKYQDEKEMAFGG